MLRELPERVRTALLVGHNPGCEDLVDLLAAAREPEAARLLAVKYATAGIAVLDVHVPWAELGAASATLRRFAVPRG